MTTSPNFDVIKLGDVISMTKMSRSSIYEKMLLDEFPKPIRLGKRAVAWLRHEVQAWLEKRASDNRVEYV